MCASVTSASIWTYSAVRHPFLTDRFDTMAAMDEDAARALIELIAREVGPAAILWRGEGLGGSDVDLVVLPAAEARLAATLTAAGLRPP